MQWFWITFLILIADTHSIQTNVQRPVRFVDQKTIPTRNYRHIDTSTSVNFDWEHGLREATLQALFREQVGDHNLRKHIYAAPLLGKHDKATPFGDIAILARGQLYVNYAGYIFVQDPYQNDCDDCYNINIEIIKDRCINDHCQIWHPRNKEQLIALWSIKRIRHRSLGHGPNRLEIEFTIAPTGSRHPNDGYLTKEGTFNYNLPGHIFVLKSSETQHLDNTHHVNHFTHGAFIAQTPDGRKYILHSFPGLLTPATPRYHAIAKDSTPTSTTTSTQYPQEDAKKVYQTLLEVLHKKTSLEPNRFTPTIPKTSTTKISDTTFVQFPDGQVIPITELETPFITKATPGYSTVRFPENARVSKPVRPDQVTTSKQSFFKPSTNEIISQSTLQTFPQTYENIPTTPYNVNTTTQKTAFVAPAETTRLVPQTITDTYSDTHLFYTKPTTANNIQSPSYHGNTQPVPIGTTNPPVKMTFHFFAAEEEKKTSEIPQNHLTTIFKNENQNFFSNSATPTETAKVFPSETTQYKIKPTQGLSGTTKDYETTRNIFTTISTARPATVVKLTKPIPITENNYSTNKITTYQPTKHSTKVTPPMLYKPSTVTHYTTKKPFTEFTVPITVLEDMSDASTTQEKYSTTQNEDIFTITQTPLTKVVATNAMNHIITQLYAHTNSDFAVEDNNATVTENSKSIRDYTTYVKLPMIAPTKENIETTLGVTKIMGASQNKTTEMIYYAAEENSASVPTTGYTEITSSTIESTEPTNTVLETELSTPKRIVTTIKADGTISVKTTPYIADEELFGLTKGSTKMSKTTKSYKVSTTEASDFLIEGDSPQDYRIPLFKKTLKDYSEDDIFGTTKQTYTKTSKKTNIRRPYIKSDLEEALFESNNTTSKALIRKKSSATESNPPKVIYYDFFEATTLAMTRQPQVTTLPTIDIIRSPTTPVSKITPTARKSFGVSTKTKLSNFKVDKVNKQDENGKPMPVTSQSYLTSISYEVNKIKKPSNRRLKQNNGNGAFENENKNQRKPKESTDYILDPKNDNNVNSTKRAHGKGNDDFAFRLVSQAKSVAYLDKISTTSASTIASISAKTTTKSKYTRRRSYVPRAKMSSRKQVVKNDGNR